MGEREQGCLPYVLGQHVLAPGPGGQRGGGPGHHDVGPHPVDLEGGTGGGDLPQGTVTEPHAWQQSPGGHDPGPQRALLVGPPGGERGRIVVVREPSPHHLHPQIGLPGGGDLDGQPEAVEQLRAQLPFFGVHRPDEQEARGMPYGDAFALDVRGTHGGGVEQQVDQVVVEQVDLVDVQDAAMRVREEPRLEGLHALGERPLDVERPDEPVLGRADRQLHGPRRPRHAGPGLVGTVGTRRIGGAGSAGEPAAGDDGHLGHERGQRADRGGLGGALLAAHEDATHGGAHRVEQQSEPEIVLPDDGGEGVRRTHKASLTRANPCPSGARAGPSGD